MAAPTLTSSATSTWSDNVNTDEVTGTLTWNSGDRIVVVGMTEDQGFVLAAPTATGLTFTALGTAVTVSNSCWLHVWQATAGSSGSSTVTASRASSTGVAMRGIAAFAWGSCTGFVRTNKGGGAGSVNSTQTVSVTRTQANSAIITITGDWSAGSVASIAWTPAGGTQVVAQTNTGGAAAVGRWGDQGATGTTSYGTTGMAGNAFTISAVEVLGTVSSSTTASAENAVAAGAANNAVAAVTPAAENATGTGTAENAVAVVVAMAETATASAAANNATAATGGGGGGSESLFTNQTPSITDASDGTPGITTATTVRFAVDGEVSAARFYATVTVGGTYTVGFWRVDSSDPGGGTLLASKTLSSPPTGGTWNTVNFDTPVPVLADTPYRVGVFSSAGRYVATSGFFTGADLVNGNITADQPGDTIGAISISQGTFRIDSVFEYPNTSGGGASYFTDVVFAEESATSTTATAECATASGTAYDATVSTSAATIASAEAASATAEAGQASIAVVALAEAATAAGTAYQAVIGVPGGTQSLHTSQTPTITDNVDGAPGVTLGVTFRSAVDGQITGIRFYSTETISGTYSCALYQVEASDPGSGSALASKTMAGSPTPSTWTTIDFDTPVAITAGVPYRAAMHNTDGRYVASTGVFVSDLVNGDLTADADGDTVGAYTIFQGCYRTGGPIEYPNSPASGSDYFVDVAFNTVAAVVALAEVATATAEVPFDTGTQISLTLVADAPIDAVGAAYDASTALVVAAECATAAGTANQATVETVTATVAVAEVATAAGAAYDATAVLVVPAAETATAVGVAYTPGVAAIPEVVVAAQVTTAAASVPTAVVALLPPVDTAEAAAAAFDAVIATGTAAELAEAAAVAGDAVISVVVVVPEPASAVASVFAPTATAGPVWIAPAECATATAEAYEAVAGVVAMAGLAQAGAVAFDAVAGPTPVEVIVAWLATVRDTTPAATVRRSV